MCALHGETLRWWPETIRNETCSHETQCGVDVLMYCISSNLKVFAGWKYMCHVIGGISSEINTENGQPAVNYYFRYHI